MPWSAPGTWACAASRCGPGYPVSVSRGFSPRCIEQTLMVRRRSCAATGARWRRRRRSSPLNPRLPHHAGRKSRLAARRLDVLFQKAMRFAPGIAGAGIGPGAAFVVGGAGRLAGVVAVLGAEIEAFLVATQSVD